MAKKIKDLLGKKFRGKNQKKILREWEDVLEKKVNGWTGS